MSDVKKTVNKSYRKKFRSPMAGMSAGIKTGDKEENPKFTSGMDAGLAFNKEKPQERKEKVVKKVWRKKKKNVKKVWNNKKIFKNRNLKSKAATGMAAGKEVKVNLNDFNTIIKEVTGKGMDTIDLGDLVKKFTGGDINLGNLKGIFEKVTGKSVDLGLLGNIVKKVTGNDLEIEESSVDNDVSQPLSEEKSSSKGGGIITIIIIGIAIYILSRFF